MEYLEYILTNVLELKGEFPIWKTLIHIYCEHIEVVFSINDEDVPGLVYSIDTKAL